MQHIYDLVTTKGTYTNKDGEQKYINKNIGRALKDDNGNTKLVLDASVNLAGLKTDDQGNVWVNCFAPQEKQENKPKPAATVAF